MSTLQVRVEQYLGTIADTAALSDQLTAGAKFISDILPIEKLEKYSVDQTDAGSGYAVTGGRVLGAHKSGYGARPIKKENKASASDSSSLFKATTRSPVWYVEAGKVYILPGGGSVNLFSYPTAAFGDSTISGFPSEYEHGVILWTAIQQVIDKLNTATDSLGALSYSAPSVPSAPLDASYSYSNAALGTYTATTIGSLGTAPTYTKPTISMTAAPSDLAFSIGLTAPSAPSAPSFTYTDAILGSYTATVVGSLGTAPTYTPPTATIDGTLWATAYPNYAAQITTALTAITTQTGNAVTAAGSVGTHLINAAARIVTANTEIGLANAEADKMAAEIASAKVELGEAATEVDISMDSVLSSIATASGRINTAVALANVEFDKIPAIIDLANVEFDLINTDIDTASTSISTAEELEKGQRELNVANQRSVNGDTYLKEARERANNGISYLEEARGSFSEVQAYAAQANAKIQQITAQIEVAGGYFNAATGFANAAQRYIETATAYLNEVQKDIEVAMGYGQQTTAYLGVGQGYATEVQARLANVPMKVSEFNAKVNDALNTFNKEAAVYQSTVQKAIEDARLTQERILKTASDTKDINIQNEAQTLASQVQQYQASLSKFSEEINLYIQNTNKEVILYKTNLEKWQTLRQTELAEFNANIQNELNEFQKELSIYQSTVQSAIKQAELDQGRLMLNAGKTTDLNIQNAAQTLMAAIELYRDKLGKYNGQLNSYGSEVQNATSKYSLDIQKINSQLGFYQNLIKSLKDEFDNYLKVIA